MTINPNLYDRLKQFGASLNGWRIEADRLQRVVDEAVTSRQVDEDLLVEIENSAGKLYQEIAAFDAMMVEIGDASPVAAAQLAAVGEALHLLLLEITELGTKLYSIRSTVTEHEPVGPSDSDSS